MPYDVYMITAVRISFMTVKTAQCTRTNKYKSSYRVTLTFDPDYPIGLRIGENEYLKVIV